MFRLASVSLFRLVDAVEGVEAGAQQVLFGLASATPHGLYGIHCGRLDNSALYDHKRECPLPLGVG